MYIKLAKTSFYPYVDKNKERFRCKCSMAGIVSTRHDKKYLGSFSHTTFSIGAFVDIDDDKGKRSIQTRMPRKQFAIDEKPALVGVSVKISKGIRLCISN